MVIACLSLIAFKYTMDYGFESMQQIQFVSASEDGTYEQDELYTNYIESAKLQKDLMEKQKKGGQKTWTMNQYKQYNARKLKAKENAKLTKQLIVDKMANGEQGWHLLLKDDFNDESILNPDKNGQKVTIYEKDGVKVKETYYKFKNEKFEAYEQIVNA